MPKPKNTRLSVFKGREAKLNRAIFHILALTGPQTIYELHKVLKDQREFRHVFYANINKRVRFLEETHYIKKAGTRKTKAGFEAVVYEIGLKAYLTMMLSYVDLEDSLTDASETTLTALLGALLSLIRGRPQN